MQYQVVCPYPNCQNKFTVSWPIKEDYIGTRCIACKKEFWLCSKCSATIITNSGATMVHTANCSSVFNLDQVRPTLEDLRQDFSNSAENLYPGGGIRSRDFDKPDYEAMLSPLAMEFYAEYMFYCSFLPRGKRREEDNWQNGVPRDRWLKSLFRHVFHLHRTHRNKQAQAMDQAFANCAIIFNGMGYLHEFIKQYPELLEELKKLNLQRMKNHGNETQSR